MGTESLRMGIVGAGFVAHRHVEGIPSVPGVEVVAVADSDSSKSDKLADIAGAAAYTSMEKMIDEANLDILDVCLPSTLHRMAVVAGLDAGLDVIVEKPFAISLEDIDAMIKRSEETKRRLMVAQVCRFKAEFMFVHSLIESEDLGSPRHMTAWRESSTPMWSWNSWLLDRSKSGGTLMDLSIHDIDISNWFFGVPNSFSATEVSMSESGGPSHVVSNIGYPSGARSVIEASHLMPDGYPFTSGFRVLFEKGVVECEFRENDHGYVDVFRENERERTDFADLPPICGNNPYAEEIKHFVDGIRNRTEFKLSLQDARLAVDTALTLIDRLSSNSSS